MTNLGVGDVEQILANNKVGILIYPSDNLAKKCDDFINLIKNKAVSKICRETSENLFSVKNGCNSYKDVYKTILNKI